jgi:pSer/pThr/pTyr-binding forkhead associated (FHA) protein
MAAPRLKMIRGPEIGREYELEADTITIGRGINNTVIIRDNEISKEHCRLVRVLDDYEIYDVASTNGTFVNGQRVSEQGWLLTPGNRIELGYSILLEYVSAEQSSEFDGPLVTSDHTGVDATAFYLVVRRGGKQTDDYRLSRKSARSISA